MVKKGKWKKGGHKGHHKGGKGGHKGHHKGGHKGGGRRGKPPMSAGKKVALQRLKKARKSEKSWRIGRGVGIGLCCTIVGIPPGLIVALGSHEMVRRKKKEIKRHEKNFYNWRH